ncbi:hypothetical protein D3C72_1214470 [compost metagenome]
MSCCHHPGTSFSGGAYENTEEAGIDRHRAGGVGHRARCLYPADGCRVGLPRLARLLRLPGRPPIRAYGAGGPALSGYAAGASQGAQRDGTPLLRRCAGMCDCGAVRTELARWRPSASPLGGIAGAGGWAGGVGHVDGDAGVASSGGDHPSVGWVCHPDPALALSGRACALPR